MPSDLQSTGSDDYSYLDFDLEIGSGDGNAFPITVLRSPAGEAHEIMHFPLDKLALENNLLKLQNALLHSRGLIRQALSPEQQAVKDFGQLLFDTLLIGEVRSRYDVSWREAKARGMGLRLKLRVQPPNIATLPWEFLYDPRRAEYICLSRGTPVVRYIELSQAPQPLIVTLPLRILGMIANPRNLPDLDVQREKERVEEATRELSSRGAVKLVWLQGQTWRDLQRAMRGGPWNIFHFIGHGGFDANADEGIIALTDENGMAHLMHATDLGRLLADHDALRLVILNSCEGARGGDRDIFSSSASILIRRGIPAVLAMQYEITDLASIEFGRAFYEALADGLPVDAAVTEARKAISMAVTNTVEWGTPVLYMRSLDGRIFRVTSQEGTLGDETEVWLAEHYNQALSLFEAKQWAGAVALFQEILTRRQPYRDSTMRLSKATQQMKLKEHYIEAQKAMDWKMWSEAIKHFESILALDYQYRDTDALLLFAKRQKALADLYAEACRLHAAKMWPRVVQAFEHISAIDPAYPDPAGLLANARAQIEVTERENSLTSIYAKGLRLFTAGELQEAIGQFEDILRITPDYADAKLLLTRARADLAARETAAQQLRMEERQKVDLEVSPGLPSTPPSDYSESKKARGKIPYLPRIILGGMAVIVAIVLVTVARYRFMESTTTPPSRETREVPTVVKSSITAAGRTATMTRSIAVVTSAPIVTKAPVAAPASQYAEAPMLAEQVKAGKLPPLEQRLPEKPLVVGPGVYLTKENLPDWKPGVYGGTLRGAHSSANWAPDFFVAIDEPFLAAPKISDQGIYANVAESFKVENNNQDFTFTMRKGMKWSDGQPVTTEDVRFTYEDILLNDKITPVFPAKFRVGFKADGDPMKLEIVDDYTFKVHFSAPYGGFLRALAIEGWVGYTDFINPAHYLKQYHIKYTKLDDPKMVEALKTLNLKDEWWQVFTNKRCQNWDMSNPKCADYPSLYPWVITDSGSPNLLKFVRNPYYFKVDTKGQQLPYIDTLLSQQVDNVEVANMMAMTGDVDFLRESTALVKMPLYKENEDKAGFKVVLLDMHVDSSGLIMNETFDDANWQKVSQDLRFRQAVSMAINRQEIIDSIYYGYAKPAATSMGEANVKYDPDAANKLLDDTGMKKGADGFRMTPSGKPLSLLLECGAEAPDLVPVSDLVAQYLKQIGLNVTVKQIDGNTRGEKGIANQLEMWTTWSNDLGWGSDTMVGSVARAGQLWETWRASRGKSGVEPPDWIKQIIELDAKRWQAVPGSDEFNQIKAEGQKWSQDNLPYINFVEQVKYPMIVSKHLMNVPISGYAIAANFSLPQMFYDNGKGR